MTTTPIKIERIIAIFPLEESDKAEQLYQSGEWCKPKYDDHKHVFVMIRRKEKIKE